MFGKQFPNMWKGRIYGGTSLVYVAVPYPRRISCRQSEVRTPENNPRRKYLGINCIISLLFAWFFYLSYIAGPVDVELLESVSGIIKLLSANING